MSKPMIEQQARVMLILICYIGVGLIVSIYLGDILRFVALALSREIFCTCTKNNNKRRETAGGCFLLADIFFAICCCAPVVVEKLTDTF